MPHDINDEMQPRRDFFHRAFRALSFNNISGDYVEFGCYSGETFTIAYHASRRNGLPIKLWAFDSFQGLPEPQSEFDNHPRWQARTMSISIEKFHNTCKENLIPRDAYEVIPGFYDQSLTTYPVSAIGPSDISLAYIDCDLYSSTKTVLKFLKPRLKHGMIIAFDDFFCWSPTQISGEKRAMTELFMGDETWNWCPYIQFGWHGMSFVIEDMKNYKMINETLRGDFN